jgi:hypothetical protein
MLYPVTNRGRPRLAFAALFLALYAAPALAAAESRTLLIQPARLDFDQDGRLDTVAPLLAKPDIVRMIFSRRGVREIAQPAPVLAVAGVDYDRDGDLDLLVSTSMGSLLWVNDGDGTFLSLPIAISNTGVPHASGSPGWTVRAAAAETTVEGREPAAAAPIGDARRPPRLLSLSGVCCDNSYAERERFSLRSPRAPPAI